MDNSQIIEGNKLIAEFMGWKKQNNPDERWYGEYFNEHGFRQGGSSKQPLLFHSSWDRLMEVIRKIEQIPDVYDIEDFLLIRDDIITGRIEETFHTVLNFIRYYNDHLKDQPTIKERIENLQAEVERISEEWKSEINDIGNSMTDYKESSVFSYNIDRLEQFVRGIKQSRK